MAGVYPAASGPASCVTGKVEKQVTAADGTLINQTETDAWDDTTRWIILMVQAYRPDGSCIWLRLSDEVLRHDASPTKQGMTASGSTPLTMNQLTAMAVHPDSRLQADAGADHEAHGSPDLCHKSCRVTL